MKKFILFLQFILFASQVYADRLANLKTAIAQNPIPYKNLHNILADVTHEELNSQDYLVTVINAYGESLQKNDTNRCKQLINIAFYLRHKGARAPEEKVWQDKTGDNALIFIHYPMTKKNDLDNAIENHNRYLSPDSPLRAEKTKDLPELYPPEEKKEEIVIKNPLVIVEEIKKPIKTRLESFQDLIAVKKELTQDEIKQRYADLRKLLSDASPKELNNNNSWKENYLALVADEYRIVIGKNFVTTDENKIINICNMLINIAIFLYYKGALVTDKQFTKRETYKESVYNAFANNLSDIKSALENRLTAKLRDVEDSWETNYEKTLGSRYTKSTWIKALQDNHRSVSMPPTNTLKEPLRNKKYASLDELIQKYNQVIEKQREYSKGQYISKYKFDAQKAQLTSELPELYPLDEEPKDEIIIIEQANPLQTKLTNLKESLVTLKKKLNKLKKKLNQLKAKLEN